MSKLIGQKLEAQKIKQKFTNIFCELKFETFFLDFLNFTQMQHTDVSI